MKLESATIHNFRGIIDQTISIEKYALLVGANNAGKSTIIDAIRAFYEKDGFKYKEAVDFPFSGNQDNESWIEMVFGLSDGEYDSLADDYKTADRCLKVRKYFKTEAKLQDNKTAAGTISGYKSDGTLSDISFYGAKNVQSGKFGELIYIPAVSKIDDVTKLSGPSALRDLITNIMANVVEQSDVYKNLAKSVDEFADGVKSIENEDKHTLAGFETDLNMMLESWQTEFKLKFDSPSTSEIIKSMLGWEIKDKYHDKSQNIDYFGSGFQRHFIYSLIQLGAKYIPNKTTKKAKDFNPSLNLILFEEPEAFLHPPQQEELSRNLIALAETPEWQIISATHSSHFVSRNTSKIPSIVKLARDKGIVQAFQISSDDWNTIIDGNQLINDIAEKYPKLKLRLQEEDLKPEMEAIKYFLWLNPDRSSLFFANYVLLVEGPSEVTFIHKLQDEDQLKLPNGTYVLDCLGKYNIHRFMNLLGKLGIYHSVLHDDDNNSNEHEDLNKLIIDSKNPFTIQVQTVDNKLETLLALPPEGSPHRKPQHVLYCYATGIIDPDNVKTFCSLTQSCFPEAGEEA